MKDQQPLPAPDAMPAADTDPGSATAAPSAAEARIEAAERAEGMSAPAAAAETSAAPTTAPTAAAGDAADDAAATHQYRALAAAVLDSAELATRAAEAAVTISENLKQNSAEVRKLNAGAQRTATLLAVGCGVLMLLGLVFFLLMGVRLNSRMNQLDATLLAVGKRGVELNTGLAALQDIDAGIKTLLARQHELAQTQAAIEARIEAMLKQSESLVQQVPGEAARQAAESSDSVSRQVGAIQRQLQAQAGTLQGLGGELKSLRSGLASLESLRRDLERLLQQGAERSAEQARKNTTATVREHRVHYPRPAPRTDADAAAGSADLPQRP